LPEIFVEMAVGSGVVGVVVVVAVVVVVLVLVDVDVDEAVVVLGFFEEAIVFPDFGAVAFDVAAPPCPPPFGACVLAFGAFAVTFGPTGPAAEMLATDSAAIVAIARNVFIWVPPGGAIHKTDARPGAHAVPVFSAT
jgi:hypothetical protein